MVKTITFNQEESMILYYALSKLPEVKRLINKPQINSNSLKAKIRNRFEWK